MDLTILLLSLIAAPVYVHSSVQLVESGPGTVTPGGSFTLTCTVTGDSIKNVYWHWIRQAPGKALEWVGQIDWASNNWRIYYASSLQSRTTLSADASRNEYYLTMRSLTAADSATYYCARGSSIAGYPGHWGQGTTVTVTSATPTAPTVFPLSPCSQDVATASQVSMGCLIKGYFPEPATVQWNSGAITSGIHQFPSVLFPSGLYTHSSQLTVPISQWKSDSFQCNVNHAATSSRITKKIERAPTHDPMPPEVRLLHSSCNPKVSDGIIQLVCLISGFYPKELNVEWLVGSQQVISSTEPPRQDVSGYTFSTTSTINVTQADWLGGNTYYCQVTHAGSQTKMKSRARKCEDGSSCSSSAINVYILPPTPRALYTDRNSKLSCVVGNLENDQGLKFTWSRGKGGNVNPDLAETTEEQNGTYTIVSRLSVFPHDWDSGEIFTCAVEYPGLAVPITKIISKLAGKSSAPKVSIFPPPQEELNPGNIMSLSCMVNGFSPAYLDIQWLKNYNPLPEDNFVNTPAMKNNHEDSFFAYSKLSIPRDDWERSDVFTCMVVHEALPMKFTQRNMSKSQGKK